MEIVFLIAAFVFFVTAFIYALLVRLVWDKSVKTEKDWIFLFAMAALAFWCLSNALVSSFGTILEKPRSTFEWILLQTSYPLLYTVPPAIRHGLVLSQLSTTGWRKWAGIALNYLGMVPIILHLQISSRPLPEHYGPAFSAPLFFYFLLTMIEIWKRKELRTRYAQKPGSWQVTQAGLGGALLMALIPDFLCYFYPEKVDVISLVPKLGALPPALAIAYGVFRYRFMDIVLTRGLLYSSLGGLFLGLYLLAVKYAGKWLFSVGGLYPVAFVVGSLVLLFAFHFLFHLLRDGLQKGIERCFFHRRLKSAEMLKSFSQTLTSWSDLNGLCRSFIEKVTESLGLTSGAILFADGTIHGQSGGGSVRYAVPLRLLPQIDARLVVVEELAEGPLKAACRGAGIGLIVVLPCREQRGWLLLGEKRSGNPFLSAETSLIEAVCGQLAMAIDNLFLIQSKIALERQMQHREKLAAIGQLAATVAHDIRNPITGAKCLLQQVEEELNKSSQGKEYIQLALEDLERVEQSVSQLLTFARKEEFHFAEQDVTDLVRTTVHRFAEQAGDQGVTVRLQESMPVRAAVDEEKVRRVLLNLLANARDAVNGNGIIEVNVSPAGPEVEIRVSDNGHGLAPEEQHRIFEPFFTTKEKGTGLGLAIAKKIAEGHGGRITVVSTPDQRTTFMLTLPRQRPEAKAAA
jgi:signal transduction histidine kinase